MPCHVPATSVPSKRLRSSPIRSPATVLAKLNLSKLGERDAHDLLLRFSSGRWPLWRLLGLRRQGQTLFAAVVWLRSGRMDRYAVAELSLDRIAVCWRYAPSATAARAALEQVSVKHRPKIFHQRRKASR